jgi:hypothetical protein
MEDYLGIAIGDKLVVVLQVFPQVPVVVDFSVENYPQRAIVVAHGLVTAAQVNDRQTPMAQADEVIKVGTVVIGAPMLQCVGHGLNIYRRHTHRVELSADSAHSRLVLPLSNDSLVQSQLGLQNALSCTHLADGLPLNLSRVGKVT